MQQAGAAAALQASDELSDNFYERPSTEGDASNDVNVGKVLVLEKFNGGGTTCRSGGVIYSGGGTTYQLREGIKDTNREMFKYLSEELGDSVSESLLWSFVKGSKGDLQWLRELGVKVNLEHSDTRAYVDKCQQPPFGFNLYYSGSEKAYPFVNVAKPAPRGHLPEGQRSMVGAGWPLWVGLNAAVISRKDRITVRKLTWLSGLLLDREGKGDSDTRVIGVRARTMADAPWMIRKMYLGLYSFASLTNPYRWLDPLAIGCVKILQWVYAREVEIKASHGVVICTGGFCRNARMVDKYLPAYNGTFALGAIGDDGSGIEIAQGVGADLAHIDSGCSWKFIYAPLAFLKTVFVNAHGERLCNEDRYGAHLGKLSVEENDGKTWLILDRGIRDEILKELAISETMPFVERMQGYMNLFANCKKARSLKALAKRCGINPERLCQTIESYNSDIASGQDSKFHKDKRYLQPLVKPPFYAVNYASRGTCWFTPWLTMGGLKVDEATGLVMDTSNRPIQGLYAAGRAASGLPSKSYVSGLSIADCIMSGRRAARHALSKKTLF